MPSQPALPLRDALAHGRLLRDGQHVVADAVLGADSLADLRGLRLSAPLLFRDCRFDVDAPAMLTGLVLPALALERCRFSGATLRLEQCDIERDLRLDDLDGLAALTLTELRIGGHLLIRRPAFGSSMDDAPDDDAWAAGAAPEDDQPRLLVVERVQLRGDLVCRIDATAPPNSLHLDRVQAGTLLLAQAKDAGFGRPRLGKLDITGCTFAGQAEIAALDIASPLGGRLLVQDSLFTGLVRLTDLGVRDLARFQGCVCEKPLRLCGAPEPVRHACRPARLQFDDCTLHSLFIGPAIGGQDTTPLKLAAISLKHLRVAGDVTWQHLCLGNDRGQPVDNAAGRDTEAPLWRRVEVRGTWTFQAVRWDGALRAEMLAIAGGVELDGCAWTEALELARLQAQGAGLRIINDTKPESPIHLPHAQLSAMEVDPRIREVQLAIHAKDARIARLDLSNQVMELRLPGARVAELAGLSEEDTPSDRAKNIARRLRLHERPDPVLGDSIAAALVARGDLEAATEFAVAERHLALAVPSPPDPKGKRPVDFDRLGRVFLFHSSRFGFAPWRAVWCLAVLWAAASLLFCVAGDYHLARNAAQATTSGAPAPLAFNGLVYAAMTVLPFVGTAPEPPWARASGLGPGTLALFAVLLRVVGAILVALAVLGFAGVLRPKGPRP